MPPLILAAIIGLGVYLLFSTGKAASQSAIVPVPEPTPPSGPTYSTVSLSNQQIRDMQHQLNVLWWDAGGNGPPPLAENGILGPMTKSVVQGFQVNHPQYGLRTDGIVDEKTFNTIHDATLAAEASYQASQLPSWV